MKAQYEKKMQREKKNTGTHHPHNNYEYGGNRTDQKHSSENDSDSEK